jgi:hypothetical protein
MATKVEIIYEAEATSLKATVNEVNKANDAVVTSAQESSKKVADTYKTAGKSIAAAFSGNEVKKALADQNKAFDDLNNKTVPLTRVLRGLKNELNELEEAGKGGTEQFRQLEIEAARLEDQIGDTRQRVKILASDTFKFDAAVGAIQGLASGFELAQGAAALFGTENEDLEKALTKITAATAVANGVQQIAALIKEESAIKTLVLARAEGVLAVVTGTSTGAMKAFRIALAATGVGLLVIGLVALIENFDKVKRALENSIPGFKEVSNAIGGVVDTIKEWVGASDEADRAATAFESASKKQLAASDAAIERIERQIDIEKSAGRSTVALEIQREQAVINANRAIIADYTKKAGTLSQLSEEEKAKAKEVQQSAVNAVLDASAKITVIRNEAEREASEKAKEEAKKRAEAAKKAAEDVAKARENLAKLETDALQAQLDEREKILSESNAKIQELEKAFLESKFATGSAEEKKLQDAILAIKEQATKSIAEIDKKAIDDKAAKEKEAAEKAQQEAEKAAEERSKLTIAGIDAQINALKTLEIAEGTSLERRIQLIELDSQKRLELAKDNASEIKLINAETEQAIREERKKSRDEAIDQAIEIAEAVADTLGSIIELQGIQSEKRIEEINAASEAEKLAIEGSTASEVDKQRQLEALRIRTERKVAAEKRKQAVAEKAGAIFEATINAAAAAAKAAANPVQLAIAIAAGAAQIAIIAATPIPKFKKGGMVGGRSHEAGGTLIEAERGEYVVNKNSVMRNRRELDAINTSSAAFKRLIDERYVRPAILSYAMSNKRDGITVNASLNSKAMERKLDRLNKTMAGKQMIVNINGGDSRYTWQ